MGPPLDLECCALELEKEKGASVFFHESEGDEMAFTYNTSAPELDHLFRRLTARHATICGVISMSRRADGGMI